MTYPEKKTPYQLLSHEASLSKILHKLDLLKKLNQLWQKKIDSALTKHCCIANQREETLVIEVDNAAFATRLRYHIPELIKLLRTEKDFLFLKNIEWYIRPYNNSSSKKTNKKILLSDESIQLLKKTALNTKNENLKNALLKLTTNKGNSNKNEQFM